MPELRGTSVVVSLVVPVSVVVPVFLVISDRRTWRIHRRQAEVVLEGISVGRGPIANIDAISRRKRHRDLHWGVSGDLVVPEEVTCNPRDENDAVRVAQDCVVFNYVVVGA